MRQIAIALMFASSLVAQLPTIPNDMQANVRAAINASLQYLDSKAVNASKYGATGDARVATGCRSRASSASVACTGASFTSADVGKSFALAAGVSSTVHLFTTIATVTDSTHVVLNIAASNAVSNAHAVYGTDNLAAFTSACAGGKSFHISTGNYYLGGPVPCNLPVLIQGEGAATTVYYMSQSGNAFTMDWPDPSLLSWQTGISQVQLIGPAALSTPAAVGTSGAITLGGTNGAIGARVDRVQVQMFATGLTIGNGSYYNKIADSLFKYNTKSLYMPSFTANNESIVFSNTQFQSGGSDFGLTDESNCIDLETPGFTVTFEALSVVNCQIHYGSTAFGTWVWNQLHTEGPDGTNTQTPIVIDRGGNPVIIFNQPNANVGRPDGSGPSSWAAVGAGSITVNNGFFLDYKTGAAPVLASISDSGNARFHDTKGVYEAGFSDFILNTNVGNGPSWVEPNSQVVQFTAPYTAHQDDKFLQCNGGTAAVTLPTNTFASEEFVIKNLSSSASCVVTGNSGNVGSAATYTIRPGGTLDVLWRNIRWEPMIGPPCLSGDTGLTRDSAGVLDVGNCGVSDTSGSMKMKGITLAPATGMTLGSNAQLLSPGSGRFSLSKNGGAGVVVDVGTDGFLNILTRGGASSASLGVAGLFLGNGTKFTASGCSNGTLVGGAMSGSLASGTSGTCTVAVTYGAGAFNVNGSVCDVHDLTTPAHVLTITAETTSGFTFTGTTVSGDVIKFRCTGY